MTSTLLALSFVKGYDPNLQNGVLGMALKYILLWDSSSRDLLSTLL